MTLFFLDPRILAILAAIILLVAVAPMLGHLSPPVVWNTDIGNAMPKPQEQNGVAAPPVGQIIPRTDGHEAKHALEAILPETIRTAAKNGGCSLLEKYYSWKKDTFLYLCHFLHTSLVGGWFVCKTTCTELTAFAAPWPYWERKIQIDYYYIVP